MSSFNRPVYLVADSQTKEPVALTLLQDFRLECEQCGIQDRKSAFCRHQQVLRIRYKQCAACGYYLARGMDNFGSGCPYCKPCQKLYDVNRQAFASARQAYQEGEFDTLQQALEFTSALLGNPVRDRSVLMPSVHGEHLVGDMDHDQAFVCYLMNEWREQILDNNPAACRAWLRAEDIARDDPLNLENIPTLTLVAAATHLQPEEVLAAFSQGIRDQQQKQKQKRQKSRKQAS